MSTDEQTDLANLLAELGRGSQSVVYDLLRQGLGWGGPVRGLELSYFAGSVVSLVCLSVVTRPDLEQCLDAFTRSFLEERITKSGEKVSLGMAVREYQQRFQEYKALLTPVFGRGQAGIDPLTTLLMHVFECATQSSSRDYMVRIYATAEVVYQLCLDQIESVEHRFGCSREALRLLKLGLDRSLTLHRIDPLSWPSKSR